MTGLDVFEASLDEEILACETLCGGALSEDWAVAIGRLPDVPQGPRESFELLAGISYRRSSMRAIGRLRACAERHGVGVGHSVERYIVLQAYLAALPSLSKMPVDGAVHREFCNTCRLVASPSAAREDRLTLGGDAFTELAKIVTLRRFHAGQLGFDIMNMPRAWLLKVHPLDLKELICALVFGIGGFGPAAMPHVNYWRRNPMLILEGEHERALWRIAKSIERQPHVRGLIAASWLYSEAVGGHFPHLTWVRGFFVDRGAHVIDLGPALIDAGFLVGSQKRRQLYAEGKFRPRDTLVLWHRQSFLAWANSRPDLDEGIRPSKATHCDRDTDPARRSRRGRRLQSGRYTLISGSRWLYYHPRQYITVVLLLPPLCSAVLAAVLWTPAAAPVAFGLALPLICLLQYFFLQ